MKTKFRNCIVDITSKTLKWYDCPFRIEHYTTSSDNEVINLTDIIIDINIKITVADDFALVLISGSI